MPTYDDIEYDREVLAGATENELLQQIIFRMDLDRPTRESQLKASAFAQTVVDATTEIVATVGSLGVPALEEALQLALNKFAADTGLVEE